MKRILMLLLLSVGLLTAGNYSTSEAAAHVGERATVCGTVYGGYYAKSSRSSPTFLNLDGNYPHQRFTLVIWENDRHKFNAPERSLKGRKVCATGTIGSYKGIPQIVLRSPSQLR